MKSLTTAVSAASALLRSQQVAHCLIGGLAVALHGYPRATFDVDFLVRLPRPLDEFLAAAATAGFAFDASDRPLADEGLVFLHFDAARVDLLDAANPAESQMIDRATEADFAGTMVPVVRVEDLIALKLAAARPRDDLDAEELLTRTDRLDRAALLRAASDLGIEAKARAFSDDD